MGIEDQSLSAEQRLVLQTIYDWFRRYGTWPTFTEIDRPLRRTHELDTRAILSSLPGLLIVQSHPAGIWAPRDELRLRLSGIDACQGGPEDTERFIRLLRWLAQRELEFEPESGGSEAAPDVSAEEVAEHLGLEDDPLALQRLYAMLQLDNWGLGGMSSGPDGWYVLLSADVWRFRDVQTVKDCLKVRERWVAEAETAAPWMRKTPQGKYFHVRVSTKSNPTWDEVQLDLSHEELESRFLAPRRRGRPLVVNGKTIQIEDLAQLRISATEQSADEIRPVVQAELRGQTFVALELPESWRIADKGKDVTDQFITEPPGSVAVSTTVSVAQSETSSSPMLYVDARIIATIQAKQGSSSFDVGKLLGLIDELNDNYQRKNSYGAHALLRAILDHVPPILNCADFKAVANNYSWGRTDKRYMKRLLEFRDQADDALHRQISTQADLLEFDDLPQSVYVDRLLQECADKL